MVQIRRNLRDLCVLSEGDVFMKFDQLNNEGEIIGGGGTRWQEFWTTEPHLSPMNSNLDGHCIWTVNAVQADLARKWNGFMNVSEPQWLFRIAAVQLVSKYLGQPGQDTCTVFWGSTFWRRLPNDVELVPFAGVYQSVHIDISHLSLSEYCGKLPTTCSEGLSYAFWFRDGPKITEQYQVIFLCCLQQQHGQSRWRLGFLVSQSYSRKPPLNFSFLETSP